MPIALSHYWPINRRKIIKKTIPNLMPLKGMKSERVTIYDHNCRHGVFDLSGIRARSLINVGSIIRGVKTTGGDDKVVN